MDHIPMSRSHQGNETLVESLLLVGEVVVWTADGAPWVVENGSDDKDEGFDGFSHGSSRPEHTLRPFDARDLPPHLGLDGIVRPKTVCKGSRYKNLFVPVDELEKLMTKSNLAADPLMTMTPGQKSGVRTPG